MSQRRVVITGVGPVSALGLGIEPSWEKALTGQSAVAPIQAFDPSGFDARIGGEVRDLSIRDYVPKSYRKATKVMARDIELTVAAADFAARDARLATRGVAPDSEPGYPSNRMGAHIGAGLIAVDLDELTAALVEARNDDGSFSLKRWGESGMTHLTPLWLLKYLPNMLACHVTIIHDTHGPSNTITCGEASSGLSIGESLRVIQRGAADLCFCGGAESKINPMAFFRQQLTGRLTTQGNDDPAHAVRPFDTKAAGSAVGEGGGIVILEAMETFQQRLDQARQTGIEPPRAYAQVAGFGASQSVNRAAKNRAPEPDGRAMASAIRTALREAAVEPDQIDMVVPFAGGIPAWDQSEAAALATIFGTRLKSLPVTGFKAMLGNCGAGAGGVDICLAAKALAEQTIPPIINRDAPIAGLTAGPDQPQTANLRHVLCTSIGFGGQNTALLLRRM